MVRQQRTRLIVPVLAASACACSLVHAQSATVCEQVNAPAGTDYNFTAGISRWGSLGSYDLDSQPYRVRSIAINTLPIFDETNRRENNRLYRWVNEIHFDTRPRVITKQLLFKPGDVVNSGILAENERLLRKQKYVAESEIRILQKCGDEIDLEVVTREVWTLVPGINFHASGGDNEFNLGLRDSNVLGTGQRLSAFYASDSERDSYQLAYENPNLGNTYRSIKLQSDSNSDGHHYLAEYSRPFYALDTHSAWYSGFESTEEVLTQYRYGKKYSELAHHVDTGELSRGLSAGLVDGYTNRFTYGVRYEHHDYAQGFDLPSPPEIPEDLTLTYPFLQFERIEDDFAVGYNISQIYRAEDLHIGKRLVSSFGYAPGDEERWIFAGEFSDTLVSRPKVLLQWGTDWSARWNQPRGEWEDSVVNLNVDLHRGQTPNRTLYLGFDATRAINLRNGKQITLGGSTGLRGFDSHYFNGDGRVRFTAEERVFSDYHVLQLFRLGFAAFVDVGKVYGADDNSGNRTFSDVGFGMRLAPSKSDNGNVIHIDIAYPLQKDIKGRRSPQLVLESRATF
jgi:hypothetical protein